MEGNEAMSAGLEPAFSEQQIGTAASAAAAGVYHPPWLTAYDHDLEDPVKSEDEEPSSDPSEAETDSGASYSHGIEDYVTDSDSDAEYTYRRRDDEGTCHDEPDATTEMDVDTDNADDADETEDIDDTDDACPTDMEQYNIEAEQEAAGRKLLSSDFASEPESDPDTEDEIPGQPHSVITGFAKLCTSDASPTAAAASGSNHAAVAAGISNPPAAIGSTTVDARAADAAALNEIRHYQATVHNLVSEVGFRELVTKIKNEFRRDPYFPLSDRAVRVLQVAAEDYLISLFQDANTVAISAGRQKIYPEDITAARTINRNRQRKKIVKTRVVVTSEYWE